MLMNVTNLLQLVLVLFNDLNVCEKRFVANPLEDEVIENEMNGMKLIFVTLS
jgi:hypothetical protein